MKKLLEIIGSWVLPIVFTIWVMWYTNHITGLCNKAGCIITIM